MGLRVLDRTYEGLRFDSASVRASGLIKLLWF